MAIFQQNNVAFENEERQPTRIACLLDPTGINPFYSTLKEKDAGKYYLVAFQLVNVGSINLKKAFSLGHRKEMQLKLKC